MKAENLVVLYAGEPELSDLNLIKLATFMGVPTSGQSIAVGSGARGMAFKQVSGPGACLAMSARTLQQCVGDGLELSGASRFLFVYGFEPTAAHAELLVKLSGGALRGARSCDAHAEQYTVSGDARSLCGELSGLSFGPVNRSNDVVFDRAEGQSRVSEYVQIGGCPFVAGFQNGAAFTLLAGSRQILDIDADFEREARLLDYFSQFVPVMWFLRHAFGERCWQGKRKEACMIVDDPLLRKRHGFLQYDALLEAMKPANFSMSIAFIPWNCDRSDRQTADLFRRNPVRLSLNVHGCDHTKSEFGGEDEAALYAKATVARARMVRHHKLTGVPCDNVMVFPQGVFSSSAMAALKRAGYLAAVNSTPFTEEIAAKALRMRDLLAPAVLCYSGLPLFVRHYPGCVAEFALDLFLGKPALIVEHHDYFKNGYKELQILVEQINRLSPDIQWRGLEDIIRRVCLWRENTDGTVSVRFFSNQCTVENASPASRRFCFFRTWESGWPLPSVTLNGKEATPYRVEDGYRLDTELQPGEPLEIAVSDSAAPPKAGLQFGSWSYRMKVFARRHLCELRDDYLRPARAYLRKTVS